MIHPLQGFVRFFHSIVSALEAIFLFRAIPCLIKASDNSDVSPDSDGLTRDSSLDTYSWGGLAHDAFRHDLAWYKV